MRVTVCFFASLKDVVGGDRFELELPDDASVATVLGHFADRAPGLDEYRGRILTSVNLDYVDEDAGLADGDELGVFPPVSGG